MTKLIIIIMSILPFYLIIKLIIKLVGLLNVQDKSHVSNYANQIVLLFMVMINVILSVILWLTKNEIVIYIYTIPIVLLISTYLWSSLLINTKNYKFYWFSLAVFLFANLLSTDGNKIGEVSALFGQITDKKIVDIFTIFSALLSSVTIVVNCFLIVKWKNVKIIGDII